MALDYLSAFGAIAGGLGQAASGPAVSGGPASFGGVRVGSGTASTVPPPQNAVEASAYNGLAGNTTASVLSSPNLPVIAIVAGLLLVAVLFLFRPSKK